MSEKAESKPRLGKIRRLNRIAAMQFLYMWDMNPPEQLHIALTDFFGHQDQPREFYSFGEALAVGTIENREAVDSLIREYTRNWSFNRIAKVDLAILRLALYELFHRPDIPPIVSINEAIDLSKEFSTPESKRFINGILDRMKTRLNRPLRTAAGEAQDDLY
jgi:N utilization substance protein B